MNLNKCVIITKTINMYSVLNHHFNGFVTSIFIFNL